MRAIEAIVVIPAIPAANEAMLSCAEMLMADMRHMSSAEAADMAAAKTAAKATDVTSTEAATKAAAHVTAAEAAAHVTATKAATHMSAAAATAAACLCTGGEKAAGHYSGCQDLHYSSSHETLSHETLLCDGRGFRHGSA
jgi:hypothetical protein